MGLFFYDDIKLKDYGDTPQVLPIDRLAIVNDNFRLALWTGKCMQTTLMSIDVKGEVGGEVHDNSEQMLIVVRGSAKVEQGSSKNDLTFSKIANSGDCIYIHENTYHNIKNIGLCPLKLISVYAPVMHEKGTIEKDNP